MTKKPLRKTHEMAERMGITERHLRLMVSRREVPFYKVGRLNMFDEDEVMGVWLQDRKVEAI